MHVNLLSFLFSDNKTLAESGIGANTKLFLVLKKTEIPDLWAELFKLLSKHFTDKDARLVLAAFKLVSIVCL